MIARILFAALLALLAQMVNCFPAQRTAATPLLQPTAYEVMDEFQRLGAMDLWPRWDPRRTPVMIYDGANTSVFNHPSPGPEFTSLSSRQGVWLMAGRHPAVTANSSAKLGGIETATVLLQGSRASPTVAATLVIHEAFHVFERERHPAWSGNEVELFTFPVTDTTVVTAQRLEAEALRRSLGAADIDQSACWASTAMRIRQQRFATMSAGAAGYERGTELNEGLASYVEKRALEVSDSAVLTRVSFPPQNVRQRSYAVGLAIARLLDRFSPEWRATLESNDSASLDALLSRALVARLLGAATPCEFTRSERDSLHRAVWVDVDSLRANRELARMRFLSQRGWTVVVSTASGPLFPQGFDPLNVTMLNEGEVLHTRFVKLGNDRGSLEVLDRPTLTSPAGAHPMFNGLRTATVAGLPADLRIEKTPTGIRARAPGFQLDLRNARADTCGKVITIGLLP